MTETNDPIERFKTLRDRGYKICRTCNGYANNCCQWCVDGYVSPTRRMERLLKERNDYTERLTEINNEIAELSELLTRGNNATC